MGNGRSPNAVGTNFSGLLEQVDAVRVGRAETIGRPWLRRLRNSEE
jgi:hypothetical protein